MTVTYALVTFSAAAGLLTVTPGLDTALVLRTAAVEGPRRAMLAGIGICVGCLCWGIVAAIGLGALLQASHLVYTTLRACGAAYLVFLGAKMIIQTRASSGIANETELNPSAHRSGTEPAIWWFGRGLMTNLLNPKIGVFYVTFLPQFIPAGVPVTAFSMLLASIHAVEGLMWFGVLTVAVRPLSRWLRRPRVTRAIDRVTGVVLVGFGVELLLDRRR